VDRATDDNLELLFLIDMLAGVVNKVRHLLTLRAAPTVNALQLRSRGPSHPLGNVDRRRSGSASAGQGGLWSVFGL